MNSTWELKEKSKGELKVTVNGEVWTNAQNKATDKLVKKVKLDGFREGQAPKALAVKHIGKQNILMEAIDLVAVDALTSGIEEHKLEMIARPELAIDSITEEEVALTFHITVKPVVKVGQYKDLDITKDEVSVSDEEIDAQCTALQEKYAELILKEDGTVENGDTAVIDFEGFKEGVAFDGGKGENYPLVIGSGSFIPGFEEQLIGMKSGETKDIDVTFPEQYQAADLAGQPVVFKVTVHEIKSKELPELNDELVKEAGIENVETVEAFKAKVKEDMLKQKEDQAENKFTNDILTKVVENCEVEIPEVLVEDETDQMVREFEQRLQQQGFGIEQFKQITGQDDKAIREQMSKDAYSKVNVRLVLEAIANEENLTVSDEEIENEFKTIAEMYNMEVDQIKKMVSPDAIAYDLRLRNTVKLIQDSTQAK